jgi:hypothetical protein
MATLTQRLDGLGTALVNRAVSNAQWLRVATALAAARGLNIADLTQTQQAELILAAGHEFYVGEVRRHEGLQAGASAQSAKAAEVNTEFAPTP